MFDPHESNIYQVFISGEAKPHEAFMFSEIVLIFVTITTDKNNLFAINHCILIAKQT